MTADELEREHRRLLVSVARAAKVRLWIALAFQAACVVAMWGAIAWGAVQAWRAL